MQIKNFIPRPYQLNILKICKEKNTLVCLPTGTGKTKIGILLAINRLNKHENSKVIVLTPTKPLANQICKEFKEYTSINENEITLLTGSIAQNKREDLYLNSKVIVATPQTVSQDLINSRTTLDNCVLLIVDECHRSKDNFANTKVARLYKEQSKFPRVLALTASPSSSREIIDQVCNNLNIEAVEIRSEEDEDLKEFIQKKDIDYINVEFPEKFKNIHDILKTEFRSKLENLRSFGLTKPVSIINKTDLLMMQRRLQIEIQKKNASAFYGISLVSLLLKLSYAMELLETQSLNSLKEFFNQLQTDTSKAAKSIVSNENIKTAIDLTNKLIEDNVKHPKLIKLTETLKQELINNPNYKAIVFANYRNTVTEIVEELNKINIKATKFVGQADRKDKGLKQAEQIEIINKFKENIFNVLVASSVAEEGLDIPEVNAVYFYEPIGSELRKIQRCLIGDTRILMYDGSYKRIKDIKNNEAVISFNEGKNDFEIKKVIGVYENGFDDIIEITTEKSDILKATSEHRILTKEGWTKVKNLKEKDKILLAHSFKTKNKYNTLFDILPNETYICSNDLFKELIKRNTTIRRLTNELKKRGLMANEKTIWSYTKEDAIPINIFKTTLEITNSDKGRIINKLEYVKSRKGRKIDISNITLSEFMWLVGIIASDGDLRKQSKIRSNRTKPYYTYRFRVSNTNPKILNKTQDLMKKMNLRFRREKDSIEANNTIIGLTLNKLGLPLGRKSKTLKLSDEFFRLSDEAVEGFIAGHFDGDGNYNKTPCHIRIGSGSKEFAEQLHSLLLRLRILSKIVTMDKNEIRMIRGEKTVFTGDFYSIEIYRKIDVLKFLGMKGIVKTKNKDVIYKFYKNKNLNFFEVKIKSIKSVKKENTFNLEIEDNKNYIAENIIVHNSGRTARTKPGKIVFLITEGTRDVGHFYSSLRKEKKMKYTLKKLKSENNLKKYGTNNS